jgi:hypothetical protein
LLMMDKNAQGTVLILKKFFKLCISQRGHALTSQRMSI